MARRLSSQHLEKYLEGGVYYKQELLGQRGLTGIGVRYDRKRSSTFYLLIHNNTISMFNALEFVFLNIRYLLFA